MSTCIRHLHHILDIILSIFCNVKLCQRDNFGSQYPEKYVPHLFHFLENVYLDAKLRFFSKIWNLHFSLHRHFKLDPSTRNELRTRFCNDWKKDKIWAADLYLIYKFQQKAIVCISDKDRMRMSYLVYQIHTFITVQVYQQSWRYKMFYPRESNGKFNWIQKPLFQQGWP